MMVNKLSIDRFNWGKGSLLNSDGTMCCLGHLSVACGVPQDEMSGYGMPKEEWGIDPKFNGTSAFDVADMAAEINDNEVMSRPEKERRLKILFKAHGVRLTFRGQYRPGERTV